MVVGVLCLSGGEETLVRQQPVLRQVILGGRTRHLKVHRVTGSCSQVLWGKLSGVPSTTSHLEGLCPKD